MRIKVTRSLIQEVYQAESLEDIDNKIKEKTNLGYRVTLHITNTVKEKDKVYFESEVHYTIHQ